MTDLFLSYKAEDRPRVAPLVQALEADGYSVWWDADIAGGDQWRETILRYLDSAACVIVVWSKRSVGPDGHFVRDEASRALRRGAYLPVRIDKVEPPLGFGETQALNLQGWKGDTSDAKYQAILGAVRSRLGIRGSAAADPPKPAGLNRRATLIGGAVVAAAAGVGGWALLRPGSAKANSIAVLPFANLSGDPAQGYFSDGIAEELRNALSRIAGLQVVARTSSEAVRDADAKTAAVKLGVTNILTGSVRRSPAMIRVSAQLVDGDHGLERWSEIYDRPLGDSLQIQTDIASRVAEALSIRLAAKSEDFRARGGTDDPTAQDKLLRAEAVMAHADSEQAYRQALGLVDEALAIDPEYGDATAIRARLLNGIGGSYARSAAEAHSLFAQSERTAKRAIHLAPDSPSGYRSLAIAYYFQFRPKDSLIQFEKMRTKPGNTARNLVDFAQIMSETGRLSEALGATDQLIAIDPLNADAFHTKAVVLKNARRYPEAERLERHAVALGPQRISSRVHLAHVLMLQEKNDEARAVFATVPADNVLRVTWEAVLDARTGSREDALRGLARLRSLSADAGLYQEAQVLAQLGLRDEALATLERGWEARDPGLTGMGTDPLFDPISDDPRFKAMVDRIKSS